MNTVQSLKEQLKNAEEQAALNIIKSKIEENKKEINKCQASHTFRRSIKAEHLGASKVIGVDEQGDLIYQVIFINNSNNSSIEITNNTKYKPNHWVKEISLEEYNSIESICTNAIHKSIIDATKNIKTQEIFNSIEREEINKDKYINDNINHIDLIDYPKLVDSLLSVKFPFLIGNKILTDKCFVDVLKKIIQKETPDMYTGEYYTERYNNLKQVLKLINN